LTPYKAWSPLYMSLDSRVDEVFGNSQIL
jgi:hypothetical protein